MSDYDELDIFKSPDGEDDYQSYDGLVSALSKSKPDLDIGEPMTVPAASGYARDDSETAKMLVGKPEVLRFGTTEEPTVDLSHRPFVENPDGSISTIRSMGVQIDRDGQEVLVPTVSDDGWIMSGDQAVDEYMRTGKHLGKYNSVDASNSGGDRLHLDQMKHEPVNSLKVRHVQLDPLEIKAGEDSRPDWLRGLLGASL